MPTVLAFWGKFLIVTWVNWEYGPFGATHGNYDFGRSKNAMFDEKTHFERYKNAFLRYKSCILEV